MSAVATKPKPKIAPPPILRSHSFTLPKDVSQQIEGMARRNGLTFEQLVRASLKLGLVALQAKESGQGRLLWEENGETKALDVFGNGETGK